MTKASEIALLDKMISQFGRDSYIGPWLVDNRLTIVADINNDVCISAPMPNAAVAYGKNIIENAKVEATKIKADATAQAQKEIDKAREEVAGIRRHAKWLLEDAAKKL